MLNLGMVPKAISKKLKVFSDTKSDKRITLNGVFGIVPFLREYSEDFFFRRFFIIFNFVSVHTLRSKNERTISLSLRYHKWLEKHFIAESAVTLFVF